VGEGGVVLGGALALKWANRELVHLDAVLSIVKGRTACVQAGANLGVFPKRLAMEFQTVYCFEPAADLFEMMTRNAPEQNIVRFQAALGERRGLVGTSRIRRDGKPNAHEGITHIVEGGTVPTLLVDDLALPVCDLLYLDVEGMELPALRGAVDTLARCRPVCAVEINKNLKYVGIAEADVYSFFADHGYQHHVALGSDQVFVPCL
jgi:FkbM family methyltransferase